MATLRPDAPSTMPAITQHASVCAELIFEKAAFAAGAASQQPQHTQYLRGNTPTLPDDDRFSAGLTAQPQQQGCDVGIIY